MIWISTFSDRLRVYGPQSSVGLTAVGTFTIAPWCLAARRFIHVETFCTRLRFDRDFGRGFVSACGIGSSRKCCEMRQEGRPGMGYRILFMEYMFVRTGVGMLVVMMGA